MVIMESIPLLSTGAFTAAFIWIRASSTNRCAQLPMAMWSRIAFAKALCLMARKIRLDNRC
ncbi:hypothetical protein WS84_22160 [Burkholderia anthina]|nr:hypothetical protein WS84_22160 [Burkholderia anthina]KVN50500.1 hypothetical protein WT13_03475 [Burkholderia anthina]KVX31645.1 hypothetical protein WT32_24375 [Burkholderia anthina]